MVQVSLPHEDAGEHGIPREARAGHSTAGYSLPWYQEGYMGLPPPVSDVCIRSFLLYVRTGASDHSCFMSELVHPIFPSFLSEENVHPIFPSFLRRMCIRSFLTLTESVHPIIPNFDGKC